MGLNEKAEWFGAPVFIVLQAAPLAAWAISVVEVVRVVWENPALVILTVREAWV